MIVPSCAILLLSQCVIYAHESVTLFTGEAADADDLTDLLPAREMLLLVKVDVSTARVATRIKLKRKRSCIIIIPYLKSKGLLYLGTWTNEIIKTRGSSLTSL